MDPIQLPFDPDRMLADLRPWVEGGSSIHDAATVERISGRMGYGIEPGNPNHASARLADDRSAIPATASHIAEI